MDYFLGKEEITAIVENLFIANRLERGEMTACRVCEGCALDLKRARNPLVIFASAGDDITPPHQALNWIPAIQRARFRNTDKYRELRDRYYEQLFTLLYG